MTDEKKKYRDWYTGMHRCLAARRKKQAPPRGVVLGGQYTGGRLEPVYADPCEDVEEVEENEISNNQNLF